MAKILKDKKRLLYMLCIFSMLLGYLSQKVADYDYWFHYSCGEWVWNNKAVPNTAIWSWYGLENNLEWISHEWSFGLFVYGFANIFSENLLGIFIPIVLSLLITWCFNYRYTEWTKNPFIILAGTFFSGWIFSAVCVPRPQIIMYILFAFLLKILIEEEKSPSNKIWFLVPLTILWTNLHGGSYILVILMLSILICSNLFNFKIGRIELVKAEKNVLIKRLIVLLVCILVVPFNGHGLKMYLYPITNMADSVMIKSITEWRCLDLNNLGGFEAAGLIMMISFVLLAIASKNKINPFKLLIGGMWIFLALKSIRFIPQFMIVMIFIIPDYFDVIKKIEVPNLLITLLVLFIGFGGIAAVRITERYNDPINTKEFPSESLITTLQELPDKAHLLNDYNIGGYLTYKHVYTFIDGRADIYSHFTLSDYIDAVNLGIKMEVFIEKYDIDYIIIGKNSRISYWVGIQNTYDIEILNSDDNWVIYKINR